MRIYCLKELAFCSATRPQEYLLNVIFLERRIWVRIWLISQSIESQNRVTALDCPNNLQEQKIYIVLFYLFNYYFASRELSEWRTYQNPGSSWEIANDIWISKECIEMRKEKKKKRRKQKKKGKGKKKVKPDNFIFLLEEEKILNKVFLKWFRCYAMKISTFIVFFH